MVEQFLGSWQMVKSEKFDEFLSEIGISWMIRRLATSTKPTVTISQEDEHIVIKTSSAVKTTTIKFILGQEFEETRADGAHVTSKITLEDNQLVQNCGGNKPYQVIRKIEDGKLVTICKIKDIESVRVYEKKA